MTDHRPDDVTDHRRDDRRDDRLAIGRFARLTGLSIGALRHYDELDLLRPVEVDRFTGYRYYADDQVEIGRAIARLRDLEVPLEEIRAVLGTDDPAEQRRRVAGHAARVQARVDRQVRILHVLRQLSHGKERIVTDIAAPTEALDSDTHRRLGKELYNHTWSLIELTDRSPEQIDEMIAATHASAYHWSKAGGTLANAARSQWQIARVYSTLARGEPAMWHARRCLDLVEAAVAAGVADDWDMPAALETLARAQAVSGDAAAARETQARSRAALDAIDDPEDRELIEQDLNSLPI
jgi:DNA-binding transcriptional MerR regulator